MYDIPEPSLEPQEPIDYEREEEIWCEIADMWEDDR